MLKREDIRIRDPFILTDTDNKCYYMYGTTALADGTLAAANTFSVYKTRDLENFEEPRVVFDGGDFDFWADLDFWAAEVHKYNGKYYLFGSCRKEGVRRATVILVSDEPDGKFAPLSPEARTPAEWQCLDGTLYVEDGVPYLVFSHEWTEIKDGEIWAMPMASDLSRPVGEPFMLFRASEAAGVTELSEGSGDYVTDGPFLYREDGFVKMIWSSFYRGRYVVLEARSRGIRDPFIHLGSKYDFDGGHAMLFNTIGGERMISLHRPNTANLERFHYMKYGE
jgi:GH43 family beta-xylosidase